ncbi:NAD-dependent aldehyde dehydrogenase [Rivularia sp. PCC 7116]|uniref:aldehyde dehydrogenase n=1 Tax=Rivularia sp. PCC 7116 TaxID=373994 RepID=UPI00029F0A5D|nr:aldehyde dehydrogenase [Rivularia sp. PCC 7116]AFY53224.1 NAD-dependent aldehyde dehydrogenase [Rivularia sp. PCC 7116]
MFAQIIHKQRVFFKTGQTKDISFRIQQLKILKQAIVDNEAAILDALKSDVNKPLVESYIAEIVLVVKEIEYAIKNIKNWTKPKKKNAPWQFIPASATVYPQPLGVVLIIGAWNFPFQLTIAPLIGAIAAGNCAILKPSEIANHTSNLIAEIVNKYFDSSYLATIEGGVETSKQLLAEKFDHIFFTGGTSVGKIIMEMAAKNLTPVTLELGGKSPCIVDNDIDIEIAARRITWGKFLNAGQACLAPDYLLVHKKIKKNLLSEIQKCLQEFYGENPAKSPDYARIINQKQFDRLVNYLKDLTDLNSRKIIIGGETISNEFYIAPTLIDEVSWEDAIMQEEIFGPILPVIEFTNYQEAIDIVNCHPKPLALYLFSRNKSLQKQVVEETSFGGGCINHTMIHYAAPSLPFGGIGNSGIGSYHGKVSFNTFSHYKSILKKPFILDVKLLYPPYKNKLSLIKRIFG